MLVNYNENEYRLLIDLFKSKVNDEYNTLYDNKFIDNN